MEKLPAEYWSDLARLLAVESTKHMSSASIEAPYGRGVRACLEVMEEIASRDGFEVRDVEHKAFSATIHGRSAFTFASLAHLDVVPAVGEWHFPPFALSLANGFAYGRGVVDDKGPGLAAYYAARKVARDATIPPVTFALIFGTDEEHDSAGIKAYLKHYPAPDAAFSPDAAFPLVLGEKGIASIDLVGEEEPCGVEIKAHNRYNLVPAEATASLTHEDNGLITRAKSYAEKNALGFISKEKSFTFLGEAHHAADPAGGINALAHLLMFLSKEVASPLFKEMKERLLFDFYGERLGCAHDDKVMGKVTVNLANMDYHEGKFRIGLNIRVPRSEDFKRVDEALSTLTTVAHHRALALSNGFCADEKSHLAHLLLSSYQKVTGDSTAPLYIGGGTYARECPHALAFGPVLPGNRDMCHVADEAISIADLEVAYNVYLEAFRHAGELENHEGK